jgi:multiple sugar transport system permease protein
MRAGRLASPYLAGLIVLVALPALAALGLSLYEFSGIGPARFAAAENFKRLVSDQALWRSLGNTIIYVAISVPVRVAAALGLALLMYRRSRGVGVVRAAVYLPTIIPDVAYALLWLWLLNPLYGPIPAAIRSVGLDSPGWLTQPWGARVSVPLMSAFQIGEGFVIALAARRMISPRLYEAAAVDGATPWFAMTRITLPLMAPVVALLALRDVILALQVNFVPALILTGGGPRYATTYLALYTYQQGFGYFRLGYAAAISVTMFAITAVVVYVQYRLARRWRLV